jgi:tetratricopeptide (TPR) repeat protein
MKTKKPRSERADLLLQLAEMLKDDKQSLADAVSLLQRQANAEQSEQLNMPVDNWDDFNVRLKQLFRAYDEEQFDDLESAARTLYSFLVANNETERDEYWAAMPILYELNDFFGYAKSLKEGVAARAIKVYGELRELEVEWSSKEPTPEERELARLKVLYCACGANELKRAGEIEQATKMFEWLLKFTTDAIKTEKFPCSNTRATLNYHLGSLYRILEKHDRAEKVFTDTLNLLHEKADEAPRNANALLALVRKEAMVVGIGYGWINYTRGFLRRAENALATALALLAQSKHPIIPSYIKLLYGTILRCRAGSNDGGIDNAIAILLEALEEFKQRGHTSYAARASWELALAYNLARRFDDAQKHLDYVIEHTKEHPKWLTNVRILQSRQYQKKGFYKEALEEAKKALTIATNYEATLPIVDSHLAIGEVKLALAKSGIDKSKNIESAMINFKQALHVVSESKLQDQGSPLPSNPKIVAVCELRLAECQAVLGEQAAARAHLAAWQRLEANVEHEWVRELAKTVTEEVKQLSLNFVISADNPNEWDYSKSIASLRQWLLQRSLQQTGQNYSKAAELIKVKRATLYQWKDDDSGKTKRARTQS